jgi:hypothetical protein
MRAAKSGDVVMMRLLLASGADPLAHTTESANALMLAAGLGWRDGSPAAPLVRSGHREGRDRGHQGVHAGRSRHQRDDEHRRHRAPCGDHGRGSETIVKFLVESGASLTAKNKQDARRSKWQ